MPRKKSFTEQLDAMFDAGETDVCVWAKFMLKHMPKKRGDQAALLRQLADHLDERPESIEISARAVGALIEMANTSSKKQVLPQPRERDMLPCEREGCGHIATDHPGGSDCYFFPCQICSCADYVYPKKYSEKK